MQSMQENKSVTGQRGSIIMEPLWIVLNCFPNYGTTLDSADFFLNYGTTLASD